MRHDKVVVAVEYGEENDEHAEAEDEAENEFLVEGKPCAYDHWERDGEDEEVRGDVEGGKGDEVVVVGFALVCGGWC